MDDKKKSWGWWLLSLIAVAAIGQLFGDWISALGVQLGITDKPIDQLAAITAWAWDTINNRWVIAAVAFVLGWTAARLVEGAFSDDPLPTTGAMRVFERRQTPEEKRALELKALGRRMKDMGDYLDRVVNNDYADVLGFRIPASVMASIQSLILDIEKAIDRKQNWINRRMQSGRSDIDSVATYLTTIGQLLYDGHIDAAITRAAAASTVAEC